MFEKEEALPLVAQGIYYIACAPGSELIGSPSQRPHRSGQCGRDTGKHGVTQRHLVSWKENAISPYRRMGRTILYSKVVAATSDLMLIENFR